VVYWALMVHLCIYDFTFGVWDIDVLQSFLRRCVSLLFSIWTITDQVGTPYAAYIIFRFLISAIACRTIVAFELSGMKAGPGGGSNGDTNIELSKRIK